MSYKKVESDPEIHLTSISGLPVHTLTHASVCTSVHTHIHYSPIHLKLQNSFFSPSLHGAQGSNSCCRAWQQALLPAEPVSQPTLLVLLSSLHFMTTSPGFSELIAWEIHSEAIFYLVTWPTGCFEYFRTWSPSNSSRSCSDCQLTLS